MPNAARGAEHQLPAGRTKRSQQEESGDGDITQPGSGAGCDTSCAFDVAGYRGSTRQRSDYRSHGICHQNPAYSWNFALFDEAALLADAYEGSNIVEEIHKQKCEQYF